MKKKAECEETILKSELTEAEVHTNEQELAVQSSGQ